jgi:transcriptional regulator with PAS, ATPase and Fis domain
MELFGYDEGAFTGAVRGGKPGKIQLAHEGTLFLDDVDNLPAKMQVGLLRALENGQIVPLGGGKPRSVNIRVIAAANRNLEQLVREGKFRNDLYHRLRVIAVQLPPLRERSEDIPQLAKQLLSQESVQIGISEEVLDSLGKYNWPGNVRELKNVLMEAAAYTTSHQITFSDLPPAIARANAPSSQSRQEILDNAEAQLIFQALRQTGSVTQAAQRLGLHHATIYRRMKKYHIPLPTERKERLS